MADSSLDDFFAKKDKRTKKSKSKLTPVELLAKQDEPGKIEKKKVKKKDTQSRPAQSSTGSSTSKTVAEEDQEWHEFEDEKEKDYTGLRIQNLQISKDNEEEGSDRRDSDEEGEEGEEGKERREGTQGPWSKAGGSAQPASKPEPPAPEPAPKVEEPKTAGKYIPPSARYGGAATTGPSQHSRRKKGAPNLGSEDDFPTLGGSGGGGGARWVEHDQGDRHFEQVKGGRQQDDSASKPVSLTLGNKFQALKQE